MTGSDITHLDDSRLDDPVRLARTEAAHLAACAACRRRIAERDPTALFAVLAAAPLPVGSWDRVSRTLPDRGSWRHRRRASRAIGTALAAAAAGLAAVALLLPEQPAGTGTLIAGERVYSGVVRRVDSESATVVTLLPPEGDGAPVTLIIDEELEL